MSLLSRHILRTLAAPFIWGVVALTGMLLLAALPLLIDRLGGKGLEWSVMAGAILLSIPALVTLTLPMSVLTATLYAYGQLASDLEMVAMYANGVSVWRMARPALVAGIFVCIFNFLLFDQFVPNSNARYLQLITAVGNKHPTLALRPGELNRLGPSAPFLMRALRVDSGGIVHGVTIYGLNANDARRIIRGDSGKMEIAPNGRDMYLTLYHGSSLEFRPTIDGFQYPGRVEYSSFASNRFTVRDVTNQFELSGEMSRGDREKSSCQLLDAMVQDTFDVVEGTREREKYTTNDLRRLVGLPVNTTDVISVRPLTEKHCGAYRRAEDWLQRRLLSPEAVANIEAVEAEDRRKFEALSAERARQEATDLQTRIDSSMAIDTSRSAPLTANPLIPGDTTRRAMTPPVTPPDTTRVTTPPDSNVAATAIPDSAPPIRNLTNIPGTPPGQVGGIPLPPPINGLPADAILPQGQNGFQIPPASSVTSMVQIISARQQTKMARQRIARARVEFHKKYAIPLATFCFVLLGLALALKFPQGGIGLVIGGGLLIFMIFYILITAGEQMAKRLLLNPVLAMHGPLVVFTLFGLLAVNSANKQLGSNRGSGNVFASLLNLIPFRRKS